MSQIGDFMVVVTPCGSLLRRCSFLIWMADAPTTLAHQGHECQAGFRSGFLRADAGKSAAALMHSSGQNMQPGPAVLALALSRRG